VFWLWVLNGVWQAAIICYFSIYSDSFNFISSKGYSSHLWANGTMVFGMVVVISNFKIAIFSNTFSIMTVVGLLGSLLTYLISWLIVDSISTAEAYQCFV
jgi:phospholipid-transporting ATPase